MSERERRLPVIPASFFGTVLGLVGWGNSWRAAHDTWGLPAAIGEILMLAGVLVWAVLIILFAARWLSVRSDALAEAAHPVQCCFIGLVGVATMLAGIAAPPYSTPFAVALFAPGAAFTLFFALWRTGVLWQGARDPAATTPVLYLPTVAGSYVTAIGCATLGFPEWGRLVLGAGILSWFAIESVLLHRLYTAPEMPPPLRPVLRIQLAPPTVGAAAYLSVTSGPPDLIAYGLIGYGLLQLLLLARLGRWIFVADFSASAWAFTFGLTALATAMVRLVGRGDAGPVSVLAPAVFVLVSTAMSAIILRTIWLLVVGRLLPAPVPAAARA
ncbi:dicarboxylate transporter/tellurite-resistance protein TehA [Ancylobacter oerskovii]|uniref:Dicarboxylate transporter/tellurite-resistance protein TehA n=1 Tax=Ancylobacter oerskovii TaxID=459519 RepID=A0ABW4Z5Y4_9HYPH|nr:dicarboxylate transporter/tellurite-resistance protein TehA [Ancylobacter oerskovii]MBS7546417.1 dicarboxylate transporter/tellurite-resistance protein TehA [Ancylobacter oerskovii]